MQTQTNFNNTQMSQFSGVDSILNIPIPKIKVIIRKRPLNQKEIAKGETDIISIKDNSRVIVSEQKVGLDLTKYIDKKEFIFDNAYDESSNNEFIYIQNIRPMIFNAFYYKSKITCFAYGQTGSGKTFTMMGGPQNGNQNNSTSDNIGMYTLAGYDIFQILANENKFKDFKILVSFYEIYCDKLFDLLNNKNKLETREDKKRNINIVGLSENTVSSLNELMTIINFGLKEHGKITFIDLAGSEREVDKVDINKKTRIDGAEINKSLLALKECIRALDMEKSHTPFRGSKLTIVLRDSFIGDCKILMIANISPGNNSSDHTLNTLRYADRVKELKKSMNNKSNNGKNIQNQNQAQLIGNLLNKKNKNIKNDDFANTSFNNMNGSKHNLLYKAGEKKRRNSNTSSSNSFHNRLNKSIKKNKILATNKVNFNPMNNYMPFQNTQNSITSNNTPQHNLFSNTNFNTYFPQSNTNFNNINNNESKKINNLFTNINSNSLSFSKKQFPDENCNNNCDTNNNYDGLNINLNHSFCSSSNSYKGLS